MKRWVSEFLFGCMVAVLAALGVISLLGVIAVAVAGAIVVNSIFLVVATVRGIRWPHAVVLVALIAAGAWLAACHPMPDPAPLPDDGTPESACATLRTLQCVEAMGSPGPDETFGTDDDSTCEDVLRDTVRADSRFAEYLPCITAARRCEGAEACFDIAK